MLKVIAIRELRLGMFVHEMRGTWLEHPFWRKSFLLKDQNDLNKLLSSNISGVVIDTSKGLDIVPAIAQVSAEPAATQVSDPFPRPLSAKSSLASTHQEKLVSFAAEKERAKKLLYNSNHVVSSMFAEARMGKAIKAENAVPMVTEIVTSVSRNQHALTSLVRLKTKDDYTYMHSVAVCALMVALSREMSLSEEQTLQAGLAGLFHDIGKMKIDESILSKPGALSDEEFNVVRGHPEHGYSILQQSLSVDEVCLDVCLHHHEKIDGSGYPHQLKDEDISLFAKMGAVCDVYDAITSDRPYKSGWEPGISLQRMSQWDKHFDPQVFEAFVKCVGIYPIGSMVKLKSGKLGVVVDQNAASLLTPVVKVFFSTKSKTHIPATLIDLSKVDAQDKILGHEDPKAWEIHDLNEMWSS